MKTHQLAALEQLAQDGRGVRHAARQSMEFLCCLAARSRALCALLWLVSSISGQTLVDVRTQTKNVDFSGATSTIPAKSGATLPVSCKLGEMFFNTSNAPGQNLNLCAPANTWTVLAGGGSTVGTVLSATSGQFAYYGSNGSAVSGHTLVAGDIPALNYQPPLTFTGTGVKTASSTGTITANNCAKWDANGNVVDAGAVCGSGTGSGLSAPATTTAGNLPQYGNTTGTALSAGLGVVTSLGTPGSDSNIPTEKSVRTAIAASGTTFTNLTGGTNTSAALLIGSGASLAPTGSGSIAATSVPASGVTGLAASATTDTTNAGNITSGTLATAALPIVPVAKGGTGTATPALAAGSNMTISGAWPNQTVGSSVLQSSSHISEGDSITAGFLTTAACDGGSNPCAYPSLLGYDEHATLTNRAISKSQACDVVTQQTMLYDLSTPDNNAIYTMMIGTNDANVKGTGAYEAVFQGCHKAAVAWIAAANKVAANATNCTDTGTWTTSTGWALAGEQSTTNGSTKSCTISTLGGPLYAWYWNQDNSGGAFTYAVDGGAATSINTATNPAIATQLNTTYGWNLLRVTGLAAGSHTIKFTVTSATSGANVVAIGAIGTTAPQPTYGSPRVYVSGVPRQNGDANSAATAAYNADVLADVNLLAGDGLGVYFVNVRNYLCTQVVSGVCYNSLGVSDMQPLSAFAQDGGLHPNNVGHNDLKQAFEDVEQFTPYASPAAAVTFTGTGSKTVSGTAAGTSGDCAKWDANGNVVDAGAPCGSGGSGSSAWASLTPGTNSAGAFILASGASLAASGTGAITATAVPAAGVSGVLAAANLPNPSASTLGGVQSVAAAGNQWVNSISTTGVPALSQPAFVNLAGTAADAQLPSDQCILTKTTLSFSGLTSASSATPTSTLFSLPSTSTRICLVEISGVTSFSGIASLTGATVRLQSNASPTPLLYSPNQDIFGTVGPTTNNFWTDSGNMADRANLGVVAAFTFTCSSGACSSAGLTAGSVNITIGIRTMP